MMNKFNEDDEKLKRFKRIRAEKARRNSDLHEKNLKHRTIKGSRRLSDDPLSTDKFDWRRYI
jgi:hypothetical protein